MPAFGKDGIKNLNPSNNKTVWEIVNSSGKVYAVCDNESSANSQRQSLSQSVNEELKINMRTLQCL